MIPNENNNPLAIIPYVKSPHNQILQNKENTRAIREFYRTILPTLTADHNDSTLLIFLILVDLLASIDKISTVTEGDPINKKRACYIACFPREISFLILDNIKNPFFLFQLAFTSKDNTLLVKQYIQARIKHLTFSVTLCPKQYADFSYIDLPPSASRIQKYFLLNLKMTVFNRAYLHYFWHMKRIELYTQLQNLDNAYKHGDQEIFTRLKSEYKKAIEFPWICAFLQCPRSHFLPEFSLALLVYLRVILIPLQKYFTPDERKPILKIQADFSSSHFLFLESIHFLMVFLEVRRMQVLKSERLNSIENFLPHFNLIRTQHQIRNEMGEKISDEMADTENLFWSIFSSSILLDAGAHRKLLEAESQKEYLQSASTLLSTFKK